MSTTVEDTKAGTEADVTAEAAIAVGGTPDAATTDAAEALRWFEIVEVEEVGFKAFCRLPNDFQHREIRQKAQAAKGRRLRQLRHPDTDAHEALEADLDELLEREDAKKAMVGELLAEKFLDDRQEAILDCQERDEFEHIAQDQRRYLELESKPDERDGDEWKEILDHLAAYGTAIQERQDEIQKPRRESLEGLDEPTLIDMVRKLRQKEEAHRAFMDTYGFWQMYVGTLKIPEDFDPSDITKDTMPRQRYFDSEEHFREADPAVVTRISEAFGSLESALATLTSGNS